MTQQETTDPAPPTTTSVRGSALCPIDYSWWVDVFVTGIVLFSLLIFIKLSVTVIRERESHRNRRGEPETCKIILWAVMFITAIIVLFTIYMFNTEDFEESVLK